MACTITEAARYGHLGVVQWASANGCPWDGMSLLFAIMGGQLAVLQWMVQNGCPWGEWNEWACAHAARKGHLDILKWLHQNKFPWNARAQEWAAKTKHPHVLAWAQEKGLPVG